MEICIAPERDTPVFFYNVLHDLVLYYHIEAQQTPKSPFHCSCKQMNFGTSYISICLSTRCMYFCFYLCQHSAIAVFDRLIFLYFSLYLYFCVYFNQYLPGSSSQHSAIARPNSPANAIHAGTPDWLIDQSRNRKEPNVAKHLSLTDHLLMGKNFSIYFLDCCPNLW